MSLISETIRKEFKKNDDLRDAGLTTPEEVIRFDDVVYGADSRWQSLDVYRPKAMDGKKLPVIVSVHGGGWVYGDKERYQYYCMDLAKRGFAVVNFTYRLAPEAKFPASLEDTNDVFKWVLANGKDYDFDLEHVFAVGDSAGAHILGLYTCICTNADYGAKYAFQVPEGFVPSAIALSCGVYQVDRSNCNDNTLALLKDLLPEQPAGDIWRQISVIPHITGTFPPTFLMTSSGDFLKNQAPLLTAKLAANNVPFVYRFYHNPRYVLPHVFHCNIKLEDARMCNDEQGNFFQSFCGKDLTQEIPHPDDQRRDRQNGERLSGFFLPK